MLIRRTALRDSTDHNIRRALYFPIEDILDIIPYTQDGQDGAKPRFASIIHYTTNTEDRSSEKIATASLLPTRIIGVPSLLFSNSANCSPSRLLGQGVDTVAVGYTLVVVSGRTCVKVVVFVCVAKSMRVT